MTVIIDAADLEVGDIYRGRSSLRVLEADAYQVVNLRTVRSVETYRVVEAINLRTGLAASIHLRHDVEVARLERRSLREIEANIETMPDGEAITIVRADGEFWC